VTAHPDYQEKIDVLDLLISILRDHEITLSNLADKFDAIYDEISSFEEKMPVLDRALERLDGLKVKNVIGAAGLKGTLAAVKCKDWLTFQAASQGALLVAFEITKDRCAFYSVSDLFVFTYSESILEVRMLMDKELKKWLKHQSKVQGLKAWSLKGLSTGNRQRICEMLISPKMARQWLSMTLKIPEEKIVEGRVLG